MKVKLLFSGFVALVNVAALIVVGLVAAFMLSQWVNPNPAGIALIALLPMAATAIIVSGALNVVYLIVYLRSGRGSSFKRSAARIALVVVSLAVIAVASDVVYQWRAVKQLNVDENTQKGQEFQSLKTAAGSQYDFDILTPRYLPKGYTWAYGQVAGTPGQTASIFSDVRYHNSSTDFELIAFSKRPSFAPPTTCGDYQEPFDPSAPDKVYLCQLVGKTVSGRSSITMACLPPARAILPKTPILSTTEAPWPP